MNERFPAFIEECINMNSEQYWHHVLITTSIDIDELIDDFILELELEDPTNRNKTHYEILKNSILAAAEEYEN